MVLRLLQGRRRVLAIAYHERRATPTVVVRFFNTVGPRQVGTYGMVVPRFVAAALAGEPLRVFGDGSQTRCFCDVRDVADALPRLLATPACTGRVFNLGSDRPISIGDLAELVIDTLASRSTIVKVPYTDAYPGGFEDLRHRRPDLSRIREAIGFDPRTPLEQTVRDVAAALRTGHDARAEGAGS
ncbi:MAG: GDP-mannose 4,6-dehydratase [Phycisphaerales bacterium]